MANTLTTLSAAIDKNTLTFFPTAITGATVGGLAQIDQEWMVVNAIVGTTRIDVERRGIQGTIAVAHNILAPIRFCLTSDVLEPAADFGRGLAWAMRDVVSYGAATGAIALPARDTVVLLTYGSAGAYTLADPAGVPDGTMLIIASTTAQAHVVTLTTGYLGTTNGLTATFSAVGETLTLMAYKGLWASWSASRAADESFSPLIDS